MKILIINENRHNSIGGIEKYTSIIANIFKEQNHEVYEYAFNLNPERIDLYPMNKNIHPLNVIKKTDKPISMRQKRKQIRASVNDILKIHDDYDLIINQTANIKWPKFIYKSHKWLYVQHFNANFYKQKYIAGTFLQPLIYFGMWLFGIKNPFRQFSNFVVFSKEDAEALKITNKKTWIIPLAAYSKKQITDFSKLNRSGRKDIVFFGRLDKKQKQIKKMIKFCELNNLHLDIYGNANDSFKPSSNVSFKGAFDTKTISSIIVNYKYSILFSKYEGYPFTIVESLSHGLPIIVNDFCPSTKNLVHNKGYFNPDFKKFVIDEKIYTKQVEECFKFSINYLSTEHFNKNWIEVLNYFDKNSYQYF